MVDPQDADLLYQALGSPKEIWIVPEADHCCAYFVDRTAYLTRVINFFELHLKRQQPSESYDLNGVEWISSISSAAFDLQGDRRFAQWASTEAGRSGRRPGDRRGEGGRCGAVWAFIVAYTHQLKNG